MQQKKCDWMGCSEIGFFDGLDKTRLTEEAKRHIFAFLKWIFLCPYHFNRGVGNSDEKHQGPETQTRIKEIIARSNELIARSQALYKKSRI